jgi:hypothetical protein
MWTELKDKVYSTSTNIHEYSVLKFSDKLKIMLSPIMFKYDFFNIYMNFIEQLKKVVQNYGICMESNFNVNTKNNKHM